MLRDTRLVAAGLILSFASGWLMAQSTPAPPVVAITSREIDSVLKYTGSEGAGTDRQIRVADLGAYRLGVGVLKRGPTRAGAPVGAISHSQVTEVFYIVSGGATLVTGGAVANDRPFPPDTEFVRLAVGPTSAAPFKRAAPPPAQPPHPVTAPP